MTPEERYEKIKVRNFFASSGLETPEIAMEKRVVILPFRVRTKTAEMFTPENYRLIEALLRMRVRHHKNQCIRGERGFTDHFWDRWYGIIEHNAIPLGRLGLIVHPLLDSMDKSVGIIPPQHLRTVYISFEFEEVHLNTTNVFLDDETCLEKPFTLFTDLRNIIYPK